jgi:hypothetical protein
MLPWQPFRGRRISSCGSFDACWAKRGYIKCNKCQRQKGSKFLCRQLRVILGSDQQQPAYRLTNDLGLNYKTATRVYRRLQKTIHHVSGLEADRLIREIESDKAYFGGRRKGSEDVAQPEKALLLVSRSAINISAVVVP